MRKQYYAVMRMDDQGCVTNLLPVGGCVHELEEAVAFAKNCAAGAPSRRFSVFKLVETHTYKARIDLEEKAL